MNAELANGACVGCGTVCPRSCCACCCGVGEKGCVKAAVAHCGCIDCGKVCPAG